MNGQRYGNGGGFGSMNPAMPASLQQQRSGPGGYGGPPPPQMQQMQQQRGNQAQYGQQQRMQQQQQYGGGYNQMGNRSPSYGSNLQQQQMNPGFDLNADFPSLGGGGGGGNNNNNNSNSGGRLGSGQNNVQNNVDYRPQLLSHTQRQQPQFVIEKEDFPALGGKSNNNNSNKGKVISDNSNNSSNNSTLGTQPNNTQQQQQYQNQQNQQQNIIMNGVQQQRSQQQHLRNNSRQQNNAKLPESSLLISSLNINPNTIIDNKNNSELRALPLELQRGSNDNNNISTEMLLDINNNKNLSSVGKFGLLGLLGVIRMESNNVNMLALGDDLTTLGLNLNSPDVLHSTFLNPWYVINTMDHNFKPYI